eukprot:TRINITY_DN69282_c0_g1_i1.p1 TRINITY_DN69282_c0_g1~~TRINITY_DN69282_c0_g1_i1.p1  ORF type:complete len:351 (+),score=63.52 TRINITY_DN69282_c0_g1_i1:110-1054(+)
MKVVPTDACGTLDLTGHTLVVPGCGGLAHLGELCIDALVKTYGLSRVAVVRSSYLLPVAMASAWELPKEALSSAEANSTQQTPLKLTTAAELYQSASAPRLTVLQIRSQPVAGRRGAVAQEIWAWARSMGIAEMLIVAPCSSHVKVDADFAASTELRFVRSQGGVDAPTDPAGNPLPLLPLGFGGGAHAGMGVQEEAVAEKAATDSVAATPGKLRGGDLSDAGELLRGGGLARPLLEVAGEAKAAASQGDASFPTATCLLGLTSEMLDWRVTEQLAKVACLVAAVKTGAAQAPPFCVPPSWEFEAASAPPQLFG